MKYKVQTVNELGNEMLPCYEITVRRIPNIFERLLGARDEEIRCVSDMGADWYISYREGYSRDYEAIKFNSPLDKVLLTVPMDKRRKKIQKLFEVIREIKTKTVADIVVDTSKRFN